MEGGCVSLSLCLLVSWRETSLDNVQGLVDTGLGVEREAGIDLGGDLAGDDLEDLLPNSTRRRSRAASTWASMSWLAF
jgi:hypothetical protein